MSAELCITQFVDSTDPEASYANMVSVTALTSVHDYFFPFFVDAKLLLDSFIMKLHVLPKIVGSCLGFYSKPSAHFTVQWFIFKRRKDNKIEFFMDLQVLHKVF